MLHRVLQEDWSDYDARKTKEGYDKSKVYCEERWEIIYIGQLLKKHYPLKSQYSIFAAIRACCADAKTPLHRSEFITGVIKRLSYK